MIELNRRRITGCISYKPLISNLSVLVVCNKTGGTIKGDIKKNWWGFRPECGEITIVITKLVCCKCVD